MLKSIFEKTKQKLLLFQEEIGRAFSPFSANKQIGHQGEIAAQRYLKKNFFWIWKTNWKCPDGEIDIIATRGPVLIFVEVKTRSKKSAAFVQPFEAVDRPKRKKLRSLARTFIYQNRRTIRRKRLHRFRFDIIGIVVDDGHRFFKKQYYIEQTENAFAWQD